MLFHTPAFLAFFALFLIGLAILRGEARVVYTTLASYAFYCWWEPLYLGVLVGLTLYAYVFTLDPAATRRHLGLVVAAGFLPLVFFKYTKFILDNLPGIAGTVDTSVMGWKLPLGISFITFTVVAYVVDAARRETPAEPRFWHTALYVAFFPHLIAGPILRAKRVMPQLGHLGVRSGKLKFALLLFAIGAVKKVAIADQIAPFVDAVYRAPQTASQGEALIAFYGFLVQIYCDFSGYTDMALALAWLLGVHFPINFRNPYAAQSIREFWRRWHISLSRWLRDYLFIPLGGSRGTAAHTVFALLVTMVLGGLWHGAAWTFVIWGAAHGSLLTLEHLARRWQLSVPLPALVRRVLLVHVVAALWVLFRAPDLDTARAVLEAVLRPGNFDALQQALPWVVIGSTLALHRWDNVIWVRYFSRMLPAAAVIPFAAMVMLICAALSATNPSAFIYFDF